MTAAGKPLKGLRALDFTSVVAGPYCTRLLADLGVEVIKIEPSLGDSNRGRQPMRDGRSAQFAYHNAGKKSVILDLKGEAGRRAALELAAKSDIVVENWRPGVAAKLGVDYAAVQAVRPDIVYCSISGYGQQQPRALQGSYASIVEASSGFALAQQAVDQSTKPPACGLFLSDLITAVWSFGAIQAALVHRERAGVGQYIDVSMYDSILNMLFNDVMQVQFPDFQRRLHLPLKTSDGYIVAPPVTEANFRSLAVAMEQPGILTDPRFSTNAARSGEGWFELLREIERWTSTRTTQDCERIFAAASFPCAGFRTVSEALRDPQVQARGTLTSVKDGSGSIEVVQAPFLMSNADVSIEPDVPDLGQHSTEVLRDILGYGGNQIAAASGMTK